LGVVGYALWTASLVADRVGTPDRLADLRTYEQRVQALMARPLQPGSPLGCLDQPLNEPLAAGCERVLFGSPENVAAAVAFVNARVSLLADGLDAAARAGDTSFDNLLNAVRGGLENDPFGVLAYVLLQQPNCQAEQCGALTLLRDPNKVRVHLQEKTFDTLVARYASNWGRSRPVADAMNPAAPATASAAPPPVITSSTTPSTGTGTPASAKYDFPSSSSIPPVSIMSSEPAAPPPAATPASAPAAAQHREPRRPPGVRPQAPSARASAQQEPAAAAPAPVQLSPGSAPTGAAMNGQRSTAQ
jgi:hypothetical protein